MTNDNDRLNSSPKHNELEQGFYFDVSLEL